MSVMLPLMYRATRDLGLIDLQTDALDGRITFTRASQRAGHYTRSNPALLSYASNDEWLAEYDPATGVCLGRSVLGQATNRCLYARDLTDAGWVKTNGTVAIDQVGLDGASNAASSFTATSANATVLRAITLSSAARTYSVDIKRISGSGAIEITTDNGTTWTAVAPTSEYQRFSVTQTLANPVVGVRIITSGDVIAVDFNQLEDGAIATPRIQTTNATVTRSSDLAGISDLSSIGFNASAGTIIVRGRSAPINTVEQHFASFVGATENDLIRVVRQSDGNVRCQVRVSGTFVVSILLGALAAGAEYCIAFAFAENDFAASMNGGAVVTDSSGGIPTLSELRIGRLASGQSANSTSERLTYIPRRLTNVELALASRL